MSFNLKKVTLRGAIRFFTNLMWIYLVKRIFMYIYFLDTVTIYTLEIAQVLRQSYKSRFSPRRSPTVPDFPVSRGRKYWRKPSRRSAAPWIFIWSGWLNQRIYFLICKSSSFLAELIFEKSWILLTVV